MLTILSWNVNGLRGCYDRKHFLPVFRHNPEIVCVQETKAPEEKLPEKVRNLYGYHTYFSAVPAGSTTGVGLFTRHQPLSVHYGFGNPVFDNKGRVLVADYGRFVLLNISFPLGIKPMGNLDNKLKFYDAFLLYVRSLCEEGRAVIICGDFNVAHTDRDLYNPPKKPSGRLVSPRKSVARSTSWSVWDLPIRSGSFTRTPATTPGGRSRTTPVNGTSAGASITVSSATRCSRTCPMRQSCRQ